MPIDPRTLEAATKVNQSVTEGRTCVKCGYDLTGLSTGGKCPECGTIITPPKSKKRLADNLTDAPLGYLKRLATAQVVAMLSAFFGVGAAFLTMSTPTPMNAAWALVASLAWLGGMGVIVMPRPRIDGLSKDAVLDSKNMRYAVVGSQAFWVLSSACLLLATLLLASRSPNAGAVLVVSSLLLFPALLAVVPTSIYFASLADWAADSGLADRFRLTAWALVLGGVVGTALYMLGGVIPKIGGFMRLASILTFLVGVVGFIVFLFSLAQLALLAVWAIRNHVAIEERDQRIAAKQARQQSKVERELREAPVPTPVDFEKELADPAPPAPPISVDGEAESDDRPRDDRPRTAPLGHRIEREADTETYDLAPDED